MLNNFHGGTVSLHTDGIADVYAELGKFSTSGIGGAEGVAIRRSLVRDYVRAYPQEHGRLPNGRHEVQRRYRAGTMRFEALFPGKVASALVSAGCRLGADEFWGSSQHREDAFNRAKKSYAKSGNEPLRRWLLSQIEEALGSANKPGE